MPSAAQARRIVLALLGWFATNARDLPWRRTLDPYAIWVSEIMLQQTQVKTVIPYWERWMRELPAVGTLAKARQEKVLKLWEGLGYYTRVRNLRKAAQMIVSDHRGHFPTQINEILALTGIGRYTAGAIASIAFNQPSPILDGNVIRVLTRLFAVDTDPREKQTNARLWAIAEQLVREAARHRLPPGIHRFTISGSCSALNQSLMELGATVCTPKQARCEDCPLRNHCAAFRQHRVDAFPKRGPRAEPTSRRFVAFAVERGGKWLVRQRPVNEVNGDLWEFPNLETDSNDPDLPLLADQLLGLRDARWQPFARVKHSITRYRISLDAYRSIASKMPAKQLDRARWLSLPSLRRLAFSSAHRRLLNALVDSD